MMKTFYIVDGSYYIFRAFYAGPALQTRQGLPTGGIFVFVGMMLSLLKQFKPDYLAVTFDPVDGRTFRHERYPAYKANRGELPEALRAQMGYFRQVTEALGMATVSYEACEADDVMATLARRARQADVEVVLVSGDKDLMQLLDDPHISVLDTMASRRRSFRREEVVEHLGVPPEQVIDWLALAGDSSDNIPGVPGVGGKTAADLLRSFGTLEGLFQNLESISGEKRRQAVAAHQSEIMLYRALATLRTDLPLSFDPDVFLRKPPILEVIQPLFEELEFHSLLRELGMQRSVSKDYQVVLTWDHWERVLADLKQVDSFALHLITTGEDPLDDEILGLALAIRPHQAVYVPLFHRYLGAPEQLDRDRVLATLRPLLEGEQPQKRLHDAKAVMLRLERYGITLGKVDADVMLLSYLQNPSRTHYDVPSLSNDLLGESVASLSKLLGKGKAKRVITALDIEELAPIASHIADMILALAAQLLTELDADLRRLHDEMDLPLSRVLAGMQRVGIGVDVAQLQQFAAQLHSELRRIEAEVKAIVPHALNLDSPSKVATVLYDELGLTPPANSRSTDQAALESLRTQHPLPNLVLEYRQLAKLRSTYADALPKLVHPKTGRLHTQLNQVGTETGRLSSSNPNLQNIPVRTALGRTIRQAFIPAAGWKLISLDYSQIELRLAAHLSGDPTLCAAFRQGEDIHRRTASRVLGVDFEAVTAEQRQIGKTVTLGMFYGMGATSLAQSLGLSREAAQNIIAAFFQHFSTLKAYFDELIYRAATSGYATTLFGRRRAIPQLHSGREELQSFGRRIAVNTTIQGTAADLIKRAMLLIQQHLEDHAMRSRLLLQIHDELLFESPPDEIAALVASASKMMTTAVALDVPLEIHQSMGDNWAALK